MNAPLLMVERNAAVVAGHHHAALIALARAATATGARVVVAAPVGITVATATALRQAGADVVLGVSTNRRARMLLAASLVVKGAANAGIAATSGRRWPKPIRRLPHQLTMVSRVLVEAAGLRAGAAVLPDEPVAVVLTAAEGLHALAAAASGVRHLRIVHEIDTTEDAPCRAVSAALARHLDRTAALCPTRAVADQLTALFPHLTTSVLPFAPADPEARITDDERRQARADLAVADRDAVLAMVGGWWPHKDIATAVTALARTDRGLHVIAAGAPMDPTVLDTISVLPNVNLHVAHRELSATELRTVYAAADASLIVRAPGVGKESGLLADALNAGIGVIAATDDPALTAALQPVSWALVVPAADPDALAAAIDGPWPQRPSSAAPAEAGFRTAAELLDLLSAAYHRIGRAP